MESEIDLPAESLDPGAPAAKHGPPQPIANGLRGRKSSRLDRHDRHPTRPSTLARSCVLFRCEQARDRFAPKLQCLKAQEAPYDRSYRYLSGEFCQEIQTWQEPCSWGAFPKRMTSTHVRQFSLSALVFSSGMPQDVYHQACLREPLRQLAEQTDAAPSWLRFPRAQSD